MVDVLILMIWSYDNLNSFDFVLIEIRKIPVDDDGNGQSKDEDANEGAESTDELEIQR